MSDIAPEVQKLLDVHGPESEYQIERYLDDSLRTAAAAKPDLSLFSNNQKIMLSKALEVAQGGVIGDIMKRSVYYSDPKIDQRFADGSARIHKMLIRLSQGEGRDLTDDEMTVLHAAWGLSSEAGEVIEEVVSAALEHREIKLQGKGGMIEEGGDIFWYFAMLVRFTKKSIQAIGWSNIYKLIIRYPFRFEKQQALVRDEKAEEVALTSENSVAAKA